MRGLGLVGLAALLCSACPPGGGKPDGGKDGGGGGGGGGGGSAGFNFYEIDATPSELKFLSLAKGPNDRVGMAYFVSLDGGVDYELRYAEWSSGQSQAPERVSTVQRAHGLSLAFAANEEPAVAFLGGGSDQSVYWLQSDAVVSYRSGGFWTEQVAARQGNEASCGSPVSDRGFLVGLNPGLVFDGSKAYLAYRDGHDGQFPQQDWAGSDLELAEGGPSSWSKRCLQAGGDNKLAYGGHISMAMADGQPALVHDRVPGSADGTGQDVIFTKRKSDGSWTSPLSVMGTGNNQSGPALAHDSVVGFGLAVIERSKSALYFLSSQDGASWSAADPVVQAGSSGWYPSLAFDPQNHEPAIAYYHCSSRSGVNEGSCLAEEDELRLTQRVADNWRELVVDLAGGYLPKVAFLSSGKRVVAYRLPESGAVRLAVEK